MLLIFFSYLHADAQTTTILDDAEKLITDFGLSLDKPAKMKVMPPVTRQMIDDAQPYTGGPEEVDLRRVPPGIYYLSVYSNGQRIETKTIVVK